MSARKLQVSKDSDIRMHFEWGALAHELGRYRKAIAEYKKEIAEADYYKAHYNLGVILEERRAFREAIREFKKAIRGCPRLHLAHNYLGLIYTELKKYDKAIQSYKKALQLCKTDSFVHSNLGRTYALKGQNKKAIAALRAALNLAPKDFDALKCLGDLLISEDICVSEGISLLSTARRIRPDHGHVLACLAVGYLKQNRLGKARELAKRAELLNPRDKFVAKRVRQVKKSGFPGERKSERKRDRLNL